MCASSSRSWRVRRGWRRRARRSADLHGSPSSRICRARPNGGRAPGRREHSRAKLLRCRLSDELPRGLHCGRFRVSAALGGRGRGRAGARANGSKNRASRMVDLRLISGDQASSAAMGSSASPVSSSACRFRWRRRAALRLGRARRCRIRSNRQPVEDVEVVAHPGGEHFQFVRARDQLGRDPGLLGADLEQQLEQVADQRARPWSGRAGAARARAVRRARAASASPAPTSCRAPISLFRQPADSPRTLPRSSWVLGGWLAISASVSSLTIRPRGKSFVRASVSRQPASALSRPSTAGLRLGSFSRFHASSGVNAKLDGSASRSISSSSQSPRPVLISLLTSLREDRRRDG